MGNSIWKKYDGEEPLEAFLNRNRPSQIQNNEAAWISVPYIKQQGQSDDKGQEEEATVGRSSAMMAEWKGLEKSVKNVTAETLKDLALKYEHTTGKWMIFAKSDQIDELWFIVAKAVNAGKLGDAAKVSPRKPDNSHVICIYTKDFTDEEDVRRVEKGLRDAGIYVGMQYKPDIYTTLNIYAKNKFGIPASVYKSQAVKKG